MKTEGSDASLNTASTSNSQQQQQQPQPQPQPSQPQVAPGAVATPYSATQWNGANAQIPIDPVLQQHTPTPPQQQPQTPQTPQPQQHVAHPTTTPYQHYQYASHYPQAAYPTHYQAYAPQPIPQPQQLATSQQPQVHQYQMQQPAYQPQTPARPPVAAAVPPTNAQPSSGGMDTADIATLNDALGSAGVDLRAEEETLHRAHEYQQQSYRHQEDRTRLQPTTGPSFDVRFLGPMMRTVAATHKITKVPDDAINYLALALRARLQDALTSMIRASKHRTDTQFDRPAAFYEGGGGRSDEEEEEEMEDGSQMGAKPKKTPMWSIVVRSDVAKQLAVLERVEREEEMRIRRERKERLDMAAAHAAALAAQANGQNPGGAGAGAGGNGGDGYGDDMDGGAKKKRKKEGPGVTARNMSDDVRKKMSNAVATQAAGLGGKYSWMNAANANAAAALKPKPAPVVAAASPATTSANAGGAATGAATTPATTTAPAAGAGAGSSSWARPYVPTKKTSSVTPAAQVAPEEDTRTLVTMRDALFVIEKERGHGGGRGAARGWV